jgi:hypothetical protein
MLFVLCLWNLVCNSLHILHPFAHCDWLIYSVENAAGEVHLVGSKTFCILWQVFLSECPFRFDLCFCDF